MVNAERRHTESTLASHAKQQEAQHGTLPDALDSSPAIVLLVDRDAGTVVYANRLARQLAPATPLPTPLDAWAQQAGLRNQAGTPLGASSRPLSGVFEGHSASGSIVTAARGSQRTLPGDELWVMAFALTDTPTLVHHALVVFLPLGDSGDPDQAAATALDQAVHVRERAVAAADVCFTISDPRAPDNPLIWANPAFLRMTGYEFDDVVGRNLRFLQGPETDPRHVAEVRAAIEEQRATTVTLLNYRRDGQPFWNQLSLSPVFDSNGDLVNFVGVQVDVTTSVTNERARAATIQDVEEARQLAVRAQADSDAARADAERAQLSSERAARHLVQMAELTAALTATLDVDEALTRLTTAVVPALGDWCVVNLVDDESRPRQVAARHRDPGRAAAMKRYLELQPHSLTDTSPTTRVLHGETAVLGTDLTAAQRELHQRSPEFAAVVEQLGAASYVAVPLRARRRTHGALILVNMPDSPRFGAEELELLTEIGRRAGLAIDNARLYAREHDAAISLQRSLLPVLPTIEGLELHAEYLAGAQTAEVGGDWYDVLPLENGCIGLAIGDVMGHDLAAAAAMGQLRSVLRSYAWEGDEPANVLARLDRLVQGLGMAQLATCCYLRLEWQPGRGGRVTVSNAGHPSPLLLLPDGTIQLLDGATSPPIGVPVDVERGQRDFEVPRGATMLLFTDGLVEDRNRDLDAGLAELTASAALTAGLSVNDLVSVVLAPVLERGLDDDVAVLAVRLL